MYHMRQPPPIYPHQILILSPRHPFTRTEIRPRRISCLVQHTSCSKIKITSAHCRLASYYLIIALFPTSSIVRVNNMQAARLARATQD
ncbi:hypothetical protein BDV12DRAFT_163657 [Aspergillus spectabilis]